MFYFFIDQITKQKDNMLKMDHWVYNFLKSNSQVYNHRLIIHIQDFGIFYFSDISSNLSDISARC